MNQFNKYSAGQMMMTELKNSASTKDRKRAYCICRSNQGTLVQDVLTTPYGFCMSFLGQHVAAIDEMNIGINTLLKTNI